MKFGVHPLTIVLLSLLVGCASVPAAPEGQVCYTPAEDAALRQALIGQNATIEEMHWNAFLEKRRNDQLKTKLNGLKGYCS